MGELIAAGVKAGLRFWWPALSRGWVALLALSLAGAILLTASPIVAVSLFAFIAPAAVGELYALALALPPERYARSKRLLATWALAIVFMGVLGLLFFVVLLSTLYAVAFAGRGFNPAQVATWAAAIDERGRIVASVVFIVGLLALGWAAMRVWLASAASVAENRIAMLSTWPYTRHRVIPMALARVILSLPAGVLIVLVLALSRHRANGFDALLSALVLSAVVAFAWLPQQVGAEAEYYRRRVLPPEPSR